MLCSLEKDGRRIEKRKMYQNWKEMDQLLGCCKEKTFSSSSTMITTTTKRIRTKGRGSWRSFSSCYYNGSRILVVCWLILSVGSSMAVMAYRNDLSPISSSGSSTSSNNRHGCVWSRTDSNSGSSSSSSTSNSNSFNGQQTTQLMYAPGNNPFHQQQPQHSLRNFPASSLSSSSSSMSPYYSSSSLTLNCNVRTLNDFWNYTSLSREQVEETRVARIQCSDKLIFESYLNPNNQTLFQLKNLQDVQINSCKIRKVPKGIFSNLSQLRKLNIHTDNLHWSNTVGLEMESGAFQGLSQLEVLDLSRSNIWTLFPDPNSLCPMRSLANLNVSFNRLTDVDDFGLSPNNEEENNKEKESSNNYCALSIQNLDLSHNMIRHVPRAGFTRLRHLVELRLQNNLVEELEDSAFYGLNQLRLLNLSSNRLVAVPPTIFNSNPTLREINLSNNSISAVSHQVFSGLNQLLLLDLSRNSLTSQWVRDSIFDGLHRLIVLKISFNKLTSLDSIFEDLISLQALHLDNNEIEVIHNDAFQKLSNLHILDLSNNRITFVNGNGRLFSNLFVLRQLYLDHNQIREMDANSLKNLTSLEDLVISNNLFTQVPPAIRNAGLGMLKTLDIGENRITSVSNESFGGLSQIYGLRLVDNQLTELPPGFCQFMKNLRVLNVAQNKIRSDRISSRAFTTCPHLRALRLDSNLLEEIPLNLKDQLPSLLWLNVSQNNLNNWVDYRLLPPTIEWLDLSYNQLESITKPENFPQQQQRNNNNNKSSISTTFNLKILNASFNKLSTLDHTALPPTLETLRLNHNRIKKVAEDTFIHSTNLRRVELIQNQLETLSLPALRFPIVPNGKPLPEIYLGENPFLCDCEMEWLTRVSQLSILRQYPRIVDVDGITCRPTFPRSNNTTTSSQVKLMSAKSKDFLCPYTSHCFASCHCCDFECDCQQICSANCKCYHDTAWSSNIVECSNLDYSEIPSRIPMDATEIYLDGNHLKNLTKHIFLGKIKLLTLFLNNSHVEAIQNKSFNGLKALEVLHLENNKLRELQGFEFANLETLRELYLQNNVLQFIAKETFASLTFLQVLRLDGNLLIDFHVWELSGNKYLNSVMISNNPWECNCEFLLKFKGWVASSLKKSVVDFAFAKCQQHRTQQLEQDGSNSRNSSAIINFGGGGLGVASTSNPTISSMCDSSNPALLPSAVSASNHAVLNNHISSMGGAAGPYHHAHLETHEEGNYHQQRFPQNEKNIFATSTAAGVATGSKVNDGDDDDDEAGSGNSTFFACLLTFIILIASIAIVVGLILFKRGRVVSCCFAKCGITAAATKCLSTPNSHGSNNDGSGGNNAAGDMDYYSEKLFDAYFIYSQKDENFVVEKLMCELERGGGGLLPQGPPQHQQYYASSQITSGGNKLRLCLHYRDLCLAPDNPWNSEMILGACEASRKVILIVSNNFLNCEWSNYHFRASVQSAIQQHSRKFIVIKVPPVSDNNISTICSAISAVAEQQQQQQNQRQPNSNNKSFSNPSTTKLEWGDKNFWPKFRASFPYINRNDNNIISNNFGTISSHATSQLPYTTNLNPNGMNFNNGGMLPYQIPMIMGHHPHHQQQQQQQQIYQQALMGQEQGIPSSLLLGHSSAVHPIPSQVTPQHFGYSNLDVNGQQAIHLFHQQQMFPNNGRQSMRHLPQHPHHQQQHHQQNYPGQQQQQQHIHSLSQLSNMSSNKSPVDYSSSAVSSGEEDHLYSTLDSSPCSDLGAANLAGQFEAAISGAQVNRHQIQHSTSSGISSGSEGGCHPVGGGGGGSGNNAGIGPGPPMYFV